MVCSICFEKFAAPVALPCGHIFCRECIQRAMEATRSCQPCTLQHFCPTCRAGYSSVAFDPAILPAYIRPHILPAIRPVFFDEVPPESSAIAADCESTSATSLAAPTPATDDDAEMLRLSCETWRQRAETHAAANAGLLSFARVAKEYTLRMRLERDQALNCCAVLERKLANLIRAGEVDAFPAEQGPVQHTELSESRMQPNLPPSQSGRRVDLEFDLLTW